MKPINHKRNRAFALFLALAMCLGLLQTFAFADEGEGIFSAIADAIAETTGAEAADAADAGSTDAADAGSADAADAGSAAHEHDFDASASEFRDQTCNAPGLEIRYKICSACGARVVVDEIPIYGPAVAHQWHWVHYATESKAPTCVDGYDFYYESCVVCGTKSGATKTEVAPAIVKHTYVDGVCQICNEKEGPEAASCDHDWLDWIDLPEGPVTAPTCGADGLKTQWRGCLLCDAEETREVPDSGMPATGAHDWSDWKPQATGASKEATCAESGYYTERRVCSLCNAKDHRQVDTPATGEHNYADGVCTVCKAQEPAPHEHSWGAWIHQGTASTAATCTTAGLDVYIRLCNICNVQDAEKLTYVISAGGHSYVNGVCTACGEDDPDAPLPEPEFLVTCADGAQRVNAGGTAAWTVMLANNGDTEIQAVMSSNVPVYALYNGAAIRPQQYINIKPGTAGVLTVKYITSKDTLSAVDDVVLTFVDSNSGISDGITLRYVVDGAGPGPVNPDPVNPDPVNPDPVNPDPVDPTPVNPTPTPTPTPGPTTPVTPAPAPAAPAITAPAAVTAPAAEEELDEDETPTADPEDEDVDEPETPTAAPEEDLNDPATPLAAPVETLGEIATPLAAPGRAGWAVLNLILMLCTGLASALLLLDPTGREYKSRSGILRLASLAPAVVALVAFLLTENLRLPMALTDRWTLLMVLIALVQLAVCVVAKAVQNNESDGSAAARA